MTVVEKLRELLKLIDSDEKWTAKRGDYGPKVAMEGREERWSLDGHSTQVWQCDDPQDGCMDSADQWMREAELIAALRNAAPRLLAVVEAAKALLNERSIREAMAQQGVPQQEMMAYDPRGRLISALKALDEG